MYDVESDPYSYPGTNVLRNKLGLRSAEELVAFEAEITSQRASEPLPEGDFDYAHYRSIHHHLFQDVYEWAGQQRMVRIGKDGNWFCFPEHIEGQMNRLLSDLSEENLLTGLDGASFARRAAHYLAELNAIHPFREGNGRAQLSFVTLLAENAGHPLKLDELDPSEMLDATILSFGGDEGALERLLKRLV
jgi:cell filamentation protein